MPYIITKKCLGERYGTCASVCPVDCIKPGNYNGEPFMIIDPDVCIECGLCAPECPVSAIVDHENVDPEAAKLNRELAAAFKNNPPVTPRGVNEPPRKPGNKK
ncbi:MAG: 4Fe-4S binding protein [Candidatus Omnitrophica bacterium]|nr:4Fe-4S binding protein [Candidatus Omnitrophota bacterium]